MRAPRDYQIACVEHTINNPSKWKYYVLPTGTGKTRVLTMLVDHYRKHGRVLLLAHRRELIHQTAEAVWEDIPDVDVGIVMGLENQIHEEITVATVQTLSGPRLEWLLEAGPIRTVLIDECHHAIPGSRYEKIIEEIAMHNEQPIEVIGCTATPFRADKADMQRVLPDCTFTRSIADMQAEKWLSPLEWRRITLPLSFEGLGTSMLGGEKDYKAEELYTRIHPQTAYIVEQTAPHFGERPAMVFSVNVAHAYELAEGYQQAGIHAVALDAKTPKDIRQDTLTAWKRGHIQCVVNCGLFTEGFDYTPMEPNKNGLGVVVVAAPTMSPSRYLQMIGRGTRLKPEGGDFSDCLVFDVAGNADLTETKQISLPKMMPFYDEEDIEEEVVRFGDEEETEEKEKKESKKKKRNIHINDPITTSWVAWSQREGVYFTSLGQETYALLVPDNKGSGLWLPIIMKKKGFLWERTDIISQRKPLNDCMHHINHVLSQNGLRQFFDKKIRKKWENRSPSEKQMWFLKKLDIEEYEAGEGETMGEISDRIAWCFIRKDVRMYRDA